MVQFNRNKSLPIMANNTPTPYKCYVFHKDKSVTPLKYPFVKSVYRLHLWVLNNERYDYDYINVYNRKTGVYLCRQYQHDKYGNTNMIIDKPTL